MLERLGFPQVGRHRRFVVAMAVDAIGSGVFLPVSVLYFLATTSLSLTQVGLALSIASGVQLPMAPVIGTLVDRVGAKRVLLAANVLETLGFAGYVLADSFATVVLSTAVVQLGVTSFWGSYSPVVASFAAPGERERWFGFLGAMRNASFAIGGVMAALVVSIGTDRAYTAAVVLNGASYVLAFLLILSVRSGGRPPPVAHQLSTGVWRGVLTDRGYLLLVATNFAYAMSAMALNVAVPVYLIRYAGMPGWLAGTVFTVNTVLIGLCQGLVVTAMTGRVRARIVGFGMLLYAASYVGFLAADWTGVVGGVAVTLAAGVVYTGGELVAGPVLTALSTDAAPTHLRGRYVSIYQMSWTASSTVAPVALTQLLERGVVALWAGLAAVAVAGSFLASVLRRAMPEAAAPVTNARVARVADADVASEPVP